MKKRMPKVGDIVYSKIGVGVITKCLNGLFGDSETAYEVNYFECGQQFNRIKDFSKYL